MHKCSFFLLSIIKIANNRVTSEMLDILLIELHLSSIFDVNLKGIFKSRKYKIVWLLMNVKNKTTLNKQLSKAFSGDETVSLFRAFKEFTEKLPKNLEQAQKRIKGD